MAITTPKTAFFHLPRTGGTWVEHSLKNALGKKAEKMVCDMGWALEENGIHIPPTHFSKPINKFTYTFIRHPFDWYVSYYQFLVKDKTWDEFIDDKLGTYSDLVKLFEQVDFVGRTEELYFDLCKALDLAGETYDESLFLSQHVNRSFSKDEDYESRRDEILESESYVVGKYYE